MKKIAFFDFCETLTNFQTVDPFIDLVKKRHNRMLFNALDCMVTLGARLKFFTILSRIFTGNSFHKRLRLLQLKGISQNELNNLSKEYYEEIIKPNLLPQTMEELSKYQNLDYEVIIVSGGYTEYIKHFAIEFGLKYLIATEIEFDDKGFCKGKIRGIDCMHGNKITRIKEIFNLKEYDLENSIAFSDSITDLPLLQLVGKGIVVSKNKSQAWAKKHNFAELLWK